MAAKAAPCLRELAFPVYAARDWSPRLEGMSWSRRRLDTVTVAHGAAHPDRGPRLVVETELEYSYEGEAALARRALAHALRDGESSPDGSHAAVMLAHRARDRERRRIAATASLRRLTITVDGQPVDFELVQAGSGWAAVRRHHGLLLTVTGIEVAPEIVALIQVDDPAAALDGAILSA